MTGIVSLRLRCQKISRHIRTEWPVPGMKRAKSEFSIWNEAERDSETTEQCDQIWQKIKYFALLGGFLVFDKIWHFGKKVIHFLEIFLVFRQICLLLWPFLMRVGQMFIRPNSEKIINPFGHTATEWNSIFKIFVFFNKRLNVSVGCSNAERMARSEFISSFELFFSPPPRRRRRHLFSFCKKTFWKSTLLSKSL